MVTGKDLYKIGFVIPFFFHMFGLGEFHRENLWHFDESPKALRRSPVGKAS